MDACTGAKDLAGFKNLRPVGHRSAVDSDLGRYSPRSFALCCHHARL